MKMKITPTRVAMKVFEDFEGMLCKELIIGREPSKELFMGLELVSIVLSNRPGSSIKQLSPH